MKVELSKWQGKVWNDTHRFKVINIGSRSGKTLIIYMRS